MRVLLLVIFLLSPCAWAELPVARFDSLFPLGGQRGTEVEITVTGVDLDEAKALWFSNSGITGVAITEKKFAVKIAPEVPPGCYDVRICGLLGVSNPRSFVVGERAERQPGKPHAQPTAALPLELGVVYNGVAAPAAVEYFTFNAEAGQRVLVECAATRLDSKMRSNLHVLAPNGAEVGVSAQGELLDFIAGEKGTYLLSLHDLAYFGGPDYGYRLTIGTFPWIDFILPPAAPAGAKAEFTLYGRNLPGSQSADQKTADGHPLEKLTISLDVPATGTNMKEELMFASSAMVEGFNYRLATAQGSSNPVFIGFSRLPLQAELEPNNRPEEAQLLTPPCEVAGQFQTAADYDWYWFSAHKGDVYSIEATSQRFGRPTSPFLLVQREGADPQEVYASDLNFGGGSFNTLSNDLSWRFEAKEDGNYRVLVRDLFGGTRNDPANVYQLSLRPLAPDFSLIAVSEAIPEKKDDHAIAPLAALVRPGGTTGVRIIALRRDAYAGDIELTAEGLPSGVTCVPTHISPGMNEGMLLLTAAEKTEPWSGPVRITGTGKNGETAIVRQARGGTLLWPVKDFLLDPPRTRLTRDFLLAVSGIDPAPIVVGGAEDKEWEVPVNGKLEIPFKVARRGEFKEALKLKLAGLPRVETVPEIDVPPTSEEVKVPVDLATLKLPPGAYTLYLQAYAKGKFRGKDASMSVFSTPARIQVKAP